MAHKKTRNESTVEEPKAAPLTNKEYAKELKQLHVELVKLQQWVVAKGLKVCIAVSYTHLTLPTSDLV